MRKLRRLVIGRIIYGCMLTIRFTVSILPSFLLPSIAFFLGGFTFLLCSRYRKRAFVQIKKVLACDSLSALSLTCRVFLHLGMMYIETVKFPYLSEELFQKRYLISGEQHVREALLHNRGALLVSAHLGNWEVLGMALARKGYKIGAVYSKIFDRKIDALVYLWRTWFGGRLFERREFGREVIRFLNTNGLLFVLFDQKSRELKGKKVLFMGFETEALTAPVEIAVRRGVPLLPAVLVKEGSKRHIYIEKPVVIPENRAQSECVDLVIEKINSIIEKWVLNYPEQWVWLHRKWRFKQ